MRPTSHQRRHCLRVALLTATSLPLLLLAAPLQIASGDEPFHVHGASALNRMGRVFGIGYSDGYHTASRRPAQIAGDLPPHPTWYAQSLQSHHGHYANPGYSVSESYIAPEWIQQHFGSTPISEERYVPMESQHSVLTPAENSFPQIPPQSSLTLPSNPRLAPPATLSPANPVPRNSLPVKPVPLRPQPDSPSLDRINEQPDMELLPIPQGEANGNEEVANPYGVEVDPNLMIPSPSDLRESSSPALESNDPLDGDLLPTPSLDLPPANEDGVDLLNASAMRRRGIPTRGVIYQPSQNYPRSPLIPIQGRAPRIAVPSPWQRFK